TGAINATGNQLANTLTGNGGANILDGGLGADSLIGGDGNDTYVVDDLGDTVTETSSLAAGGIDIVQTRLNSYILGANVEKLTFTGSGDFTGTGNSLANTITGGAGNDTLSGGAGDGVADSLAGGAGNDTYIVEAGDTVSEGGNQGTDTVQTALASYTLGT